MHRRLALALLASGLVTLGLYGHRRHLLSRLLGLPPVLYSVAVERGLRVPMPDGVELVADRYHPRVPGYFPTILVRTPYDRKNPFTGFLLRLLAERGYNAVVQDVRGRFESQGNGFLKGEDVDGRATLDWVSGQPWFDGALGMWGESYPGYTQWAAAPGAPSYLKAIMPHITGSKFYPVIYPDGSFNLDVTLPISVLLEKQETDPDASFLENMLSLIRIRGRLRRGFMRLPLIEADVEASGRPSSLYRDLLAHPEATDTYWQERDHSHRVQDVEAPAHLFSGWYDMFLRELLDDYTALIRAGRKPYLTVGPYPHGSFRAMVDSLRETFAWFDLRLKGETDKARSKPVRLYVMGADEWREFDAWPPPAEETLYHLYSRDQLFLESPATVNAPPDGYRYDPADPTPAVGGPLFLFSGKRGSVDNRELEARPDVLVYTTPPLESDLEMIGQARLELYIHSSLEHADFFGRLCDVHPDGKSVNVCDGLFRIAPGEGELQPDGSFYIAINLWPTAYRFRCGHCLRLQVSSGAHPRFNRNTGTGEPLATATILLAAEQTVYHDREHPSALTLPVTAPATQP